MCGTPHASIGSGFGIRWRVAQPSRVSHRPVALAGNAADLTASTGYALRSLKLAVTAAYDFLDLAGRTASIVNQNTLARPKLSLFRLGLQHRCLDGRNQTDEQ